MTITPEQLDELAALEAKATKGPWSANKEVPAPEWQSELLNTSGEAIADGMDPETADFIAALRNAAPLVSHLEGDELLDVCNGLIVAGLARMAKRHGSQVGQDMLNQMIGFLSGVALDMQREAAKRAPKWEK